MPRRQLPAQHQDGWYGAGQRVNLRCERHTITRMPRTRAVVFMVVRFPDNLAFWGWHGHAQPAHILRQPLTATPWCAMPHAMVTQPHVQRTFIRSLDEVFFPEREPRADLEAVATRLWSAIENWPPEKVCGVLMSLCCASEV